MPDTLGHPQLVRLGGVAHLHHSEIRFYQETKTVASSGANRGQKVLLRLREATVVTGSESNHASFPLSTTGFRWPHCSDVPEFASTPFVQLR
jgi:hypothetical protein